MLDGNVEQKLCQLQEACIYKTGRGNRNCNAHKQSKMMLAKLAADGVSDACACKSQDHSSGPPPRRKVNAPQASAEASPRDAGE